MSYLSGHPSPGAALSNHAELLYRNARAEFVQDGHPSKQVFEPGPQDDKLLSLERASISSPRETFERFLNSGGKSSGVLAVSVAECDSAQVPALENALPANLAHAVSDFRQHGNSQTKKRAGQLRDNAVSRGWEHKAFVQ